MVKDEDRCAVCKKVPKGKKIGVPMYHPSYGSKEWVWLCDDCMYRLPHDLYILMVKQAQAETIDPKFSSMVINALKNTSRQYKLNQGWCLLHSGQNGFDWHDKVIKSLQFFDKVEHKPEAMDKISSAFKNKKHIHSVYQDGKLIKDEAIEKMI